MAQESRPYHKSKEQILNEQEEVAAAQKDNARFEVLYNRYHDQIFRFIYQRVDDYDLAHDTTSQVFLKAMLNLKKYQFKGLPFSAWLYRIASNQVNDLFKQNKARRTINVESTQVFEIIDELEEDNLAPYHDLLIEVLPQLSEKYLQLVEMRYFERRSFKEIGDIMGITENNAKVKLYRALERLRKLFKDNKSNHQQ